MPRRVSRVWKKAELELAHREDPEARAEIKRLGLAVGKRVKYHAGAVPEYGFRGVAHYGVVSRLHHKSVDVVMTGELLGGRWASVVLREDTVPYSGIAEVLGDGVVPERTPPQPKTHAPPPPREQGYEECDIGRCGHRPVMAYVVRKYDKEVGELGPPHIVAVCKEHDEEYVEPSDPNKAGVMQTPAHVPLVWQMGVVFGSWKIPMPKNEEPASIPAPQPPVPDAIGNPASNSPYEGLKGRHPRLCDCSKHAAVAQ